jgi:hypothetical protein
VRLSAFSVEKMVENVAAGSEAAGNGQPEAGSGPDQQQVPAVD